MTTRCVICGEHVNDNDAAEMFDPDAATELVEMDMAAGLSTPNVAYHEDGRCRNWPSASRLSNGGQGPGGGLPAVTVHPTCCRPRWLNLV
jgi:hypothetical protein